MRPNDQNYMNDDMIEPGGGIGQSIEQFLHLHFIFIAIPVVDTLENVIISCLVW